MTDVLTSLDALTALRIAVRALLYGASLLAAGSTLFLLRHPLDGATAARTRRVAVLGALAGILLAAALVLLEVLFLVGGDWTAVRDPMLWGVVLDTPIGDAQAWRVAGLGLVALLAFGPALRWPAASGALLVVASFAMVGHSLREPRPALALLVVLHVATAAYWLGSFVPLHRAARSLPPATAGALAQSFGSNAVWAVGTLVTAGVLVVVLLAGGPLAAIASDWGRLLLAKLALVSVLLGLAAVNKLRLSPALAAGDASAAGALRRSIRREAWIVAGVLLATAVMTSTTSPPGAERRSAQPPVARNFAASRLVPPDLHEALAAVVEARE